MKSTGEVMGIDADFGIAYAKSQMAASASLPLGGNIFVSVKDSDKAAMVEIVRDFADAGFVIYSTAGTADMLAEAGVVANKLFKLAEGRPNVLDMIKNDEIAFIINTPSGRVPRQDEVRIRSAAVAHRIPIMTTLCGARASISAIRSVQEHGVGVTALQDYHAG